MLADLASQVAQNRDGISKFQIARTVLVRLNEAGDTMIGPRRTVLRRITETESFESCWPDNRLEAKGLVAEVRDIVNRRDAFTRMQAERDRERAERIRVRDAEIEANRKKRLERETIRADLGALFSEPNHYQRGKRLEGVLNGMFALDGMSVREAFTVTGDEGKGIMEQIDGLVELDGSLYLVEMKWLQTPVGPGDMGSHFSRVFLRHAACGLFISASGFTDAAIAQSTTALTRMTSVLCDLEEIVRLLEHEADTRGYFREKVQVAIAERRPLHRPTLA